MKKYDVIVVGAGFAGVCAAIAAARSGLKVLIADKGNCLGGTCTQGLVTPFMSTTTVIDGKKVSFAYGIFREIVAELVKYEEISDRIEYEIATYLNEVSKNEISYEATERIKAMYKIIGEMESLGDSGESIGRILKRKEAHGKVFDKTILDRLNKMMDLVQKGYDVMIENLKNPELKDISNAQNAEYNINECRNHLREEHIVNIESNSYNYLTGVYYMDVLSELEKIGDFMINISQAAKRRYDI